MYCALLLVRRSGLCTTQQQHARLLGPTTQSPAGCLSAARRLLSNPAQHGISKDDTVDDNQTFSMSTPESATAKDVGKIGNKTRRLLDADPNSLRSQFKAIDVHPTILARIKDLGVGIPKRPKRKLKRKKKEVMSQEDESAFFRGVKGSKHRGSLLLRKKKSKGGDDDSGLSPWLPPPPFTSSHKRDERTSTGLLIKRRPVKILGTVKNRASEFPRGSKGLSEVCVAGRSNVGKSTLLNALLYGNMPNRETGSAHVPVRGGGRGRHQEGAKLPRGAKAIVSDRPGQTREITFYQLSSDLFREEQRRKTQRLSLLLVDLPGYGFAHARQKDALEWKALMQHYILNRGSSLKRVLLLLDARHGMKKADYDFLESIQSVMYNQKNKNSRNTLPPIQIVLTKCDLVGQEDLARRVVQVREQMSDSLRREPAELQVMLVSARPGVGFNNVRDEKARGGVLELQRELSGLVASRQTEEQKKNELEYLAMKEEQRKEEEEMLKTASPIDSKARRKSEEGEQSSVPRKSVQTATPGKNSSGGAWD